MTEATVATAFFWTLVAMGVATIPLCVTLVREMVREERRAKEATAFEPFVHEVSARLALPEEEVATALREAARARKVVLTPGP